MRRYWKLAVIVPFIVLGISTYYVDASSKPDYYLKTQAGNAQVAADVQLQAYAQSGMVSIGTKGSEYPSYWASLDANYYQSSLRNLVKEYPQFMRGKQNPNGFYVGHSVIGYANLEPQGNMGISLVNVFVYSKLHKTSSFFTVPLHITTSSSVSVLLRVMIHGNNMKLFTLNFNSNGDYAIHLYTLDLIQKRIVSNQTILNSSNQVSLGVVNYTDNLDQSSNYTVISESLSNHSQPLQLLVYDIRSGKVSKIKNSIITNIRNNLAGPHVIQLGNQMYVISQITAKDQWRLVQYDLAKKNIRNDFTFSLNHLDSNRTALNLAKISNHRLYMLLTSTGSPTRFNSSLAIVDLTTRKELYQGVVVRKDKKAPGNLGIYNILVN